MADRTPHLILGEIDALIDEARSLPVSADDAITTTLQCRKVNGRLWGYINVVEAGIQELVYDVIGMLNAAYVKSGKDPGDFVGELVSVGALAIRSKVLLEELRRYKLDPVDFIIPPPTPEEESE